MKPSSPYQRGYAAKLRSDSLAMNPYKDVRASEWERGWRAAASRRIGPVRGGTPPDFAAVYQQMADRARKAKT